uniref:Reverse transcriptase Ty1/copia-type domain-containing protein n=1 Tax=Physcomitrium patens TaxID=3218 RepID=A0A2K1KA68_PHYPA|nr:hypothetical protein PHYPA_009853 [Physcomitrium patens]
MAHTMIIHARMTNFLWIEAINIIAFSPDPMRSQSLLKVTPYQILFNKRPNLLYFRVFRSMPYTWIKKDQRDKFQSRTKTGFFVGYDHKSKETVCMLILDGLRNATNSTKVSRLHKSLYSLKQTPRAWFEKINDFLDTYNFGRTKADYSLYLLRDNKGITILILYVNDLLITGSSNNKITWIKNQLILKEFGMEVCTPSSTPMTEGFNLDREDDSPQVDAKRFQKLVGMFIHLVNTKPKISFTTGVLIRFMHDHRVSHRQAANQMWLHYIWEIVLTGIVDIFYISIHEQIADIFTKATGRNRFVKLRSEMGMRNLTLSSKS